MTQTTFTVFGRPQTKGSTKSFWNPRASKVVTTSDNPRLKSWEHRVYLEASSAGLRPVPGPVSVRVIFQLRRPSAHYRTNGCVKDRYVAVRPTTKPDIDKLTRGVLDGLTGIAYHDDAQVVETVTEKVYGEEECARVMVTQHEAEEQTSMEETL